MSRFHVGTLLCAALFITASFSCSFADDGAAIVERSGVQGGVIVHVPCGSGQATAQMRLNDRYLVQGLDPMPGNVARARKHIEALGVYGPISVDLFEGGRLPYADNMVNLLVIDDPSLVSQAEIGRVLAPLGKAVVRTSRGTEVITKPWPEGIDHWSHFLHSASNNAVAQDTTVATPRRMQWVCGPKWSRSHEFNSSLCAAVSSNGRIFYVYDMGQTGITDRLPERWKLVARDAFNGVLLWEKDIPKWGTQAWKKAALRSVPKTVPRRIVASGERLFMTLGYDAPVSMTDAATGEVLHAFEGTEDTQEIRVARDCLLALKNDAIIAFDLTTLKQAWRIDASIVPLATAANDESVVYAAKDVLHCVGLHDGSPRWTFGLPSSPSLVVLYRGRAYVVARNELIALNADGSLLWRENTSVARGELFIANNRIWQWVGEDFIGRDPLTGQIVEEVSTKDVNTQGHHLRCYQSKATERFLITPIRGAEFISVAGEENAQNDWLRGACFYGVIPCNGLLYVPPNPCFCYPGVKITGFNALAPEKNDDRFAESKPAAERVTRGPAFGEGEQLAALPLEDSDWPMYRRDVRRTGATDADVPTEIATRWEANIGGRVTPPVKAGQTVYVAAKDAHTMYALSAMDGSTQWTFVAGGRIDSPPTIVGGLVLFGSADGRVYCLRKDDGLLLWSFNAAPINERIVAYGQLESPWRVHGSVIVKNNVVYCTAGRSSNLDGGIWLYGLDLITGEPRYETRYDTWSRTRDDAIDKPFIPGYTMEGAQSDLLVCQGDMLFMGQNRFDLQLNELPSPYALPAPGDTTEAMDVMSEPYTQADREPNQDYETHQRQWLERVQPKLLAELREQFGAYNLGQREMGLHLITTGGFLDDSWYNRTYWMYAKTWPGYYLANRAAKTGQLLCAGPKKTYAVQAYPSRNLQSPLFMPNDKGYLLFADPNDNEPFLDYRTVGTTKGWGWTRQAPPAWHQWLPIRIRAMVLADDKLFVAGPPDLLFPNDPMAAFEGRAGGKLRTISAETGETLAQIELGSPPVFDGLIAAENCLYLSTVDGKVICMGRK